MYQYSRRQYLTQHEKTSTSHGVLSLGCSYRAEICFIKLLQSQSKVSKLWMTRNALQILAKLLVIYKEAKGIWKVELHIPEKFPSWIIDSFSSSFSQVWIGSVRKDTIVLKTDEMESLRNPPPYMSRGLKDWENLLHFTSEGCGTVMKTSSIHEKRVERLRKPPSFYKQRVWHCDKGLLHLISRGPGREVGF